jgi:hypothetical protein
MRGDASTSDRVFPITERRINYILKAIVKRAGGNPVLVCSEIKLALPFIAITTSAVIHVEGDTLGHSHSDKQGDV